MVLQIITISATLVAISSLTESVNPCNVGLIKKMAIKVCEIENPSSTHIIDTGIDNTGDTVRTKRQFSVIETPGEITVRKIPLGGEFLGKYIFLY